MMDLVHDRTITEVEEDRISDLSDEIIHRILSFVDMKDAIQTSKFSRRWKHVWTSMPHLNLDTSKFHELPQFANFMKHALSHRNNSASVSSVNLTFTGAATQFAVTSMIKYAFSHNVEELTMRWCDNKNLKSYKSRRFPQCLFSSPTLKILTLTFRADSATCSLPESGWDFPSLETLNLMNIHFYGGFDEFDEYKSLNPFSKCVNLKNLTLDRFHMYKEEIFIIHAPQLSNLTFTNALGFPKGINVVAPQLQNLRASLTDRKYSDSMLPLLTEGFNSLEKVELSFFSSQYPKDLVPLLLDMFSKLCSATVLILDKHIVKAISRYMDKFFLEPCPFNNLKCLKVHGKSCYATQAKIYLLENSPSATFIVDSPQVPQKKRSRKPVSNDGANKVAKLQVENKLAKTMDTEKRTLKAKMPTQGEVIAELRAKIQILETTKWQYEKLMPHIINGKMAELKLQVESGNPDYEVIHSMGIEIKSLIDLIPKCSRVAVEAHFSTHYKEMKLHSGTHITAKQWEKIETQLGYLTGYGRVYSNNIQIRSDVPTTDTAPPPSSTNMTTYSEEGAK